MAASDANAILIEGRRKQVRAMVQRLVFGDPSFQAHLLLRGLHSTRSDEDERTDNSLAWLAMLINGTKDDANLSGLGWGYVHLEVELPWLQWHTKHNIAAWKAVRGSLATSWHSSNFDDLAQGWLPIAVADVAMPTTSANPSDVILGFLDHRER